MYSTSSLQLSDIRSNETLWRGQNKEQGTILSLLACVCLFYYPCGDINVSVCLFYYRCGDIGVWVRVCVYYKLSVFLPTQARRRTTTQMELLYAKSDSVPDTPSGDFSSPCLPLVETPEEGRDPETPIGSSVRDRDYMAHSPGLSSKMGSM